MSATNTPARYVIGIDLGTTNTALAYVDREARREKDGQRPISYFDVPQLVAPGEVDTRPVLPSFGYQPGAYDLPQQHIQLPWNAERTYVVGTLARDQGTKVPGRLVASAKSWLSHAGVDRSAAILPWGADSDVQKISPVEASQRYLTHLREAWNERMATSPTERFEQQDIILTIPASFDEVARELTLKAAHAAGIPRLLLLEEPMAAFYAWMADHADTRDAMPDGTLILVCDIGGGTSDFSILSVKVDAQGNQRFDRLAVGEHLMLGGDNMDHALARKLEADLFDRPGQLDVQRWNQLVYQCRRAKEELLGDQDLREAPISVVGKGSGLISGTLRVRLLQDDVERLLLDGFFPHVPSDAQVQRSRRTGLTELGLPYEQDPAMTRHIAAFWRRFQPLLADATGRSNPYPDYILFNGGVFQPTMLRERVREMVQGWFQVAAGPDWSLQELANPRLDLAVARGAAAYGLVRQGEGMRIGSGSPRAWYVVLHDDDSSEQQQGVCLVPRGADEGFEAELYDQTFAALANRPVSFQLVTSTTRTGEGLGDVVTLQPEEIKTLPPIRTVLRFGKKNAARNLPVRLGARLTEIGTLELWCDAVETPHRWDLAFDIRQVASTSETTDASVNADADAAEVFDANRLAEAITFVQHVFSEGGSVESVWEELERLLDIERSQWPLPVLRKLGDAVLTAPREASADHEALWFDLLGYAYRPGHGDPVDDWRMTESWKRYLEGPKHPKSVAVRTAWWIWLRRIGGGLQAQKQTQVYYDVRPYIQLKVKTGKRHRFYPRRMDEREKREAWRALASFERLDVDLKVALAKVLLQQIKENRPKASELWALARLCIRIPLYGPLNRLLPVNQVQAILSTLLRRHLPHRDSVAYTLVTLARRTGHRDRDLSQQARQQVERWLRKMEDEDAFKTLLHSADPQLKHPGIDWLVSEPVIATGAVLHDPKGLRVAE